MQIILKKIKNNSQKNKQIFKTQQSLSLKTMKWGYVVNKHLVRKKEEIKCNNLMK